MILPEPAAVEEAARALAERSRADPTSATAAERLRRHWAAAGAGSPGGAVFRAGRKG